MDIANEAGVFQSLRNILEGANGEMQKLTMLEELEKRRGKENSLDVLSMLIKMVPLIKNMTNLRTLMMLFSRKMIKLLDELQILKTSEKASPVLQKVKLFLTACSNQQVSLDPQQGTIKMTSQWNSALIDIVTSLASIYIDLFIASHEHAENQMLWSKRLYSWLCFDLNPRAVKTALLEVSLPSKRASGLLAPVLKKIVSIPVVKDSHLDYLLHMLVVKRWADVCSRADIETSRHLKAPKKFTPWLCARWNQSHEYVPQDKSLKGRRVSEFLLDLNDEVALESLIDMYSDCLSGKEGSLAETEHLPMEATAEEDLSLTSLFVVDKRGAGCAAEVEEDVEICPPSQDKDVIEEDQEPGQSSPGIKELFVVDRKAMDVPKTLPGSKMLKGKMNKLKRKWEGNDATIELDGEGQLNYFMIPDRKSDPKVSPAKKRRKLENSDDESNGVVCVETHSNHGAGDVGEKASMLSIPSNEDGDSNDVIALGTQPEKESVDGANGEETVGDLGFPKGVEHPAHRTPKRISKSDKSEEVFIVETVDEASDIDEEKGTVSDESDAQEVRDIESEKEVIGNESDVEETHLKPVRKITRGEARKLVISDPVGSYFAPQTEVNGDKNSQIDVLDLTEEAEVMDKDEGIVSPSTLNNADTFIDEITETERGNSLQTPSQNRKVFESPDIKTNNSSTKETLFEIRDVCQTKPMLESEISRKLSLIRKSTSESSSGPSTPVNNSAQKSTRRSSRNRSQSDEEKLSSPSPTRSSRRQSIAGEKSNEEKTAKEESSSSALLKDWIRSPPKSLSTSQTTVSKVDSKEKGTVHTTPKTSDSSPQPRKTIKMSSLIEESANSFPSSDAIADAPKALTKSDVFPPTYSRITRRSLVKMNASLPSDMNSASPKAHLSTPNLSVTESVSYNLRSPKQSPFLNANKSLKKPSRNESHVSPLPNSKESAESPKTTPQRITREKAKKLTNAKGEASPVAKPSTPRRDTRAKTSTDSVVSTPSPSLRKSVRHASKDPR